FSFSFFFFFFPSSVTALAISPHVSPRMCEVRCKRAPSCQVCRSCRSGRLPHHTRTRRRRAAWRHSTTFHVKKSWPSTQPSPSLPMIAREETDGPKANAVPPEYENELGHATTTTTTTYDVVDARPVATRQPPPGTTRA
ncbi:hypothetical protein IWX46DRAFT_595596, partial [Phyllosticta citricarpa]